MPPARTQAHKASLQRKLAERQADVAAQAAELAVAEKENEGLRARIATQTVHPQARCKAVFWGGRGGVVW